MRNLDLGARTPGRCPVVRARHAPSACARLAVTRSPRARLVRRTTSAPAAGKRRRYASRIESDGPLIIEVAQDSALESSLRRLAGADTEFVVVGLAADPDGRLSVPRPGQVVLSVASAEALPAHSAAIRRVVDDASAGSEPLVIEVEEMETLREEELRPVLEAARHAHRSVIVRVHHTVGA